MYETESKATRLMSFFRVVSRTRNGVQVIYESVEFTGAPMTTSSSICRSQIQLDSFGRSLDVALMRG